LFVSLFDQANDPDTRWYYKRKRWEERCEWWEANWRLATLVSILLIEVAFAIIYVHFPWVFDLRLVVVSK
jgi:hypothetical protein